MTTFFGLATAPRERVRVRVRRRRFFIFKIIKFQLSRLKE